MTASDQIRQFNTSVLPPPRIPRPCITITEPGRPRPISFDFGADPTVNGDYSYTDAGISDEQFRVVQGFINDLNNLRRPGDIILNANLTHRMNFNGPLPADNIPNLGGMQVTTNQATNRRTDNYIGDFYRNATGAGNTIKQNYQSQTFLMRNMLRSTFGPTVGGNTIWGAPNGRRYRFRGVLLRPTTITHKLCF